MSIDKDLESIKNGNGLSNSSTSNNTNQSSTGITTEQRSQNKGIRTDKFTHKDSEKKGKK